MSCIGNNHWNLGVLLLLAVVAAYFDLKARRIPNAVLLAGGAIVATLSLFLQSPPLRQMLGGLLTGIIVFLPAYLIHKMGAGDVKLMGLAGAYTGVKGILVIALLTMLAGGMLALGFVLLRRGNRLPYAVAILAGVAAYVLLPCTAPALPGIFHQGAS